MSDKFINQGYLHIKNDNKFAYLCSELNKSIKKKLKINSRIFLNKKSYLKNRKHIKTGDILSKLNIDFILKNKKIKDTVENVIGKNYLLVSKRVICGIPEKYLPNYITQKENIRNINLGHFIKKKYRIVRYFNGIDFHQDQMDYSGTKCNVVTLYVYLDEVSRKKSPLIILPKSHKLGPDLFPHNLKKERNKILYKTRKNKKIRTNEHKLVGKAGESWLWHSCMLHGTRSNISTSSRFSLRLLFKKNKKNKNTPVDKINKIFKDIRGYKITNEFDNNTYDNVYKNLNYSTKR